LSISSAGLMGPLSHDYRCLFLSCFLMSWPYTKFPFVLINEETIFTLLRDLLKEGVQDSEIAINIGVRVGE
jgi:hypothetical protein